MHFRKTLAHHWLFCLFVAVFNLQAAAGNSGSDGRSQRVDKLFRHFDDGSQPGAAVMVILEGTVVHSRGYGLANLRTGERISADSTFRLGSVSKQFTAMGIALLIQRGELGLDEPVAKYVPVLANYPGLTVGNLVHHSSGLPDYYDVIDLSQWEEAGTIPGNSDVIAYLAIMNEPRFGPGEKFEYSNPAYEVLPLVIEAITAKPFADFMRDEVFQPNGMDDSLVHDHRRPDIPRQVTGYALRDGGYEMDDWDTLNGITGSGSQFSTLEDFYAWDQALYGNELLTPALLELVFTPGTLNDGSTVFERAPEEFMEPGSSDTGYGFAWQLDYYRGHRRQSHGGAWVGFNTAIARFPGQQLTIVILSNRQEYLPSAVAEKVADIYLEAL